MNPYKPRLALDTYVLAQGVKTGVWRVCDELFARLAHRPGFDVRFMVRDGDQARSSAYLAAKKLPGIGFPASVDMPAEEADILLSPFGVAPARWLMDPGVLQAHIVYDLIGIRRPEFFSAVAAAEVRDIIDSLDEHTVVFAISDYTRDDLLACRPDLDPAQVTVIPLAAGPSFRPCSDMAARQAVRAKYAIPPEVPYVLSLATLEVRKNLDRVVEAFVRRLERQLSSPMHLVLAGMSGWKLEQLEAALEAAGPWRQRIVLTGFVEDEDLSALYSDALCFVYLSRYEGFGLPPLEAMACGTPVICADNSSLPEVVGDAGILLDADDVEGVAAAIEGLEASAPERARLSQAGIARAERFSWERCADIVAETLQRAWLRHQERPSNRRRLALLPGALATGSIGGDGMREASVLGYLNGSRGPRFHVQPQEAAAGRTWPQWADALPPQAAATGRVEGGRRTRGEFKTGTAELPLVSFVTVVRNNTQTLARTIDSVQQQTYPNVEHIVLDGASTDGTLDLIRRYGDRLDYFVSEPDSGLYDAVNKAIPLARGQLICVLNSDDWLEPDAAALAVRRMKPVTDPCAILCTAANVKGAAVSHEWYPALVHPGSYFTCANDCHNGIYATRAAYERSGPYDTSYKIVADFKWIMTCMDAGVTMVYTREVSVNYSLGGTSGDVMKHSIECMRVVQERFPFLAPAEVVGLYHCFFGFAKVADEAGRPADRTAFLRQVFARHAGEGDFREALHWAMVETLKHPDDMPPREAPLPAVAPGRPSVKLAVKEAVKEKLRRHPSALALARKLYDGMKGR